MYQELANAVVELERIQVAILALSSDRPDGWKRELVSLRRDLQLQIGKLASVPVPDDRHGAEYRRTLSQMRAALALHQAEWPAVATDPDNKNYRDSAAALHIANRAFLAIAKSILADRRELRPDLKWR